MKGYTVYSLAFTMDNPLALIVSGALVFALVGFAFGALVYWFGERGGSRLGSLLAGRLGPIPENVRRAVSSGLDGAVFLGVVGLIVGFVGGPTGLLWALSALALLIGGTLLFAGLAHNLTGRRSRAVITLCGTVIGAIVGLMVTDGRLVGIIAGAFAGLLASVFVRIEGPHASNSREHAPEADE